MQGKNTVKNSYGMKIRTRRHKSSCLSPLAAPCATSLASLRGLKTGDFPVSANKDLYTAARVAFTIVLPCRGLSRAYCPWDEVVAVPGARDAGERRIDGGAARLRGNKA